MLRRVVQLMLVQLCSCQTHPNTHTLANAHPAGGGAQRLRVPGWQHRRGECRAQRQRGCRYPCQALPPPGQPPPGSSAKPAPTSAGPSGEIGANHGLAPGAGSAWEGGGAPGAPPLKAQNPGGGPAPGPPCSGTPQAQGGVGTGAGSGMRRCMGVNGSCCCCCWCCCWRCWCWWWGVWGWCSSRSMRRAAVTPGPLPSALLQSALKELRAELSPAPAPPSCGRPGLPALGGLPTATHGGGSTQAGVPRVG